MELEGLDKNKTYKAAYGHLKYATCHLIEAERYLKTFADEIENEEDDD